MPKIEKYNNIYFEVTCLISLYILQVPVKHYSIFCPFIYLKLSVNELINKCSIHTDITIQKENHVVNKNKELGSLHLRNNKKISNIVKNIRC